MLYGADKWEKNIINGAEPREGGKGKGVRRRFGRRADTTSSAGIHFTKPSEKRMKREKKSFAVVTADPNFRSRGKKKKWG